MINEQLTVLLNDIIRRIEALERAQTTPPHHSIAEDTPRPSTPVVEPSEGKPTGTHGSMATDKKFEPQGYITPKGENANIRSKPNVTKETFAYQLLKGQYLAAEPITVIKGSDLSGGFEDWYHVEGGHYVRADVVDFRHDKPAPKPTSTKYPAPIERPYVITNRHKVNGHTGYDLATFTAMPEVRSHAPGGYVVKVASCNGCSSTPHVRNAANNLGYGNFAIVSYPHPGDSNAYLHCLYAHLSSLELTQGTMLLKGDVIGRVGSTGDSTGNHLHIEVRIGQTRDARWATLATNEVDPTVFFDISEDRNPPKRAMNRDA